MTDSNELTLALRAAARDLFKRGEETTLRYEHLDAIRSAPGDQSTALAELMGVAKPPELAAVIHVARLLQVPGLNDAIAEAALRRPAPLSAKRAAIRALREIGTEVPEAVSATLTQAEDFVARPDMDGLRATLDLPETWRQPTLDAWIAASLALAPEVAAEAVRLELVPAARVAERLGVAGDEQAVTLLREFVAGSDRDVAKAAKRALHQLKARGVAIADDAPREVFSLELTPDVSSDSLAYVTGVDGLGGRIVWLLVPNTSGGYDLLEAVIDDVHGIRKADLLHTSRGEFRKHMARLRENPSVLLAQASPADVAAILQVAEPLNAESATDLPAGYGELRAGIAAPLFDSPSTWDDNLPAAPAGEDQRREALRDAVELLGASYFSNWAILGEAAENAAVAVRAAETSELVADDEQRKQQVDQAVAGVATSFDEEQRARFKSRLHEMARVLAASGNPVEAARARVAGDGFETVTDLYADHPFARAIIQRGVMTAYQHLREHEPPPAPDAPAAGGIIRP
jgi:hypothetical protein